MKSRNSKSPKKEWQKPEVRILDIKKDTFGGSAGLGEGNSSSRNKSRSGVVGVRAR